MLRQNEFVYVYVPVPRKPALRDAETWAHGFTFTTSAVLFVVQMAATAYCIGFGLTGPVPASRSLPEPIPLLAAALFQFAYGVGFFLNIDRRVQIQPGSLMRFARCLLILVLVLFAVVVVYSRLMGWLPPYASVDTSTWRGEFLPGMSVYGHLAVHYSGLALLSACVMVLAARGLQSASTLRSLRRVRVAYPPRLRWLAELESMETQPAGTAGSPGTHPPEAGQPKLATS